MSEKETECLWDGRYFIRREIARGGMCRVHAAEHAFTGRMVAIKAPAPDHYDRDAIMLRIRREAQTLELCRHPNVVEILDAGVTPGCSAYIVMEMLEGRTVEGILAARRTLSVADTVSIGRQLCDALARISRHGIVHRDVKSNNLIVTKDGSGAETLKLIDFGIAHISQDCVLPALPKLTKLDELLGTPEYMAPEQMLLRPVDHRADIYGAAATLFECLTGSVPYPGQFGEILMRLHTEPVPSIRRMRPDISPQLAAVIEKGLAREPEDRYPDALSFGVALVEAAGVGLQPTNLLGLPRPAPSDVASLRRTDPPEPPPPPTGLSRRRFARIPFVSPVRLTCGSQMTFGRTEDISEGGLLVLAVRPYPLDESILLDFSAPISGRPVSLVSRVRWVREAAKERFAIGLEFEAVDEVLLAEVAALAQGMQSDPRGS